MSANQESDPVFSDVSCRILVLSSKISQAKACIDRIQSRSKPQSSPLSAINNGASALSDSSGSSEGLVPWTITNKYYSAFVHFAAHRMHGLSPAQLRNIPAVIFAWSQGESYKHHIERIAQDLSGSEPEVCLAVRLPSRALSRQTSPISDEEEEHDDVEIDGFLSSYGFEFIDATEKDTYGERESFGSDVWFSGIPGIERVLDALSTIMWPSMKTTSKVDIRSPQGSEHALLDWANISRENSLGAVKEMISSSSEQMSARTKAMKREMEELAEWLEEEDVLQDDPWKSAVSTGRTDRSSTAMESGVKLSGATEAKFGFDDDFTVFVSAPALDASEISGCSTPDMPTDGLLSTGLHAGSLYRTLGSVSDFGGSEDEKDADHTDIDDDLPSKGEILATSSRIFGSSKPTLPPTIEIRTNKAQPSNASKSESSMAMVSKTLSANDLDAFSSDERLGPNDVEPFDLSKVLGALQEMKVEISNLQDESERRRAAARVALGLVYGLEATAEH